MSQSIDRRQFLQRAAASSVAMAAWGQTQTARAWEQPSAKVVLGIMGTNGRGAGLAKEFAELPGADVAYICDVDSRAIDKGLRAVSEQGRPTPQGVGDFRRILDDPAVDALVVAAPDHWHAPATILACDAGKHVYVEKPACHNGREGELMIAAARKHDRVVQLGTQRRSSAGVTEAIQRVREGEIGPARFARCWINSTRPNIGHGQVTAAPDWLDYDLWQGPAPAEPYRDNLIHYNWHWFWNWGTGELGNNGVHALDLCRWALEVDYPQAATCAGGKLFFDDDQETPDTQLATFDFGDKLIHWEHRTWHRRGFENQSFGAIFYGDRGSLVLANGDYTIYEMDGKRRGEPVKVDRGEYEHLENFMAAIRGDARLNAEIEEGVKTTLLCHLGNIAYRTGRTVRFDPGQQRIVGDAECQALWGREYAPGWEPQV